MVKKVFLLIALYNLIGLISCCRNSEANDFNFKWSSIDLKNFSYEFVDNKSVTNLTTENDFSRRNFGIQIMLNHTLVTHNRTKCFKLFPEAYALKCKEDVYKLKNRISSIQIKCHTDFNSTHLKNADVTEYFKMRTSDEKGNFKEFIPINESETIREAEFYSNQLDRYNINVFLITKPDNDTPQKFEITIKFEDDSEISSIINELILN